MNRLGQLLLLVVAPLAIGGVGTLLISQGRSALLDEVLAITFVFAIAMMIARRIWPGCI